MAHPGVGLSTPWKAAICIGLCGGFTTYSTFNLEVLKALNEGRGAHALGIVALTLCGALLASIAGWALAGQVTG